MRNKDIDKRIIQRFKELSIQRELNYIGNFSYYNFNDIIIDESLIALSTSNIKTDLIALDYLKNKLEEFKIKSKILGASITLVGAMMISFFLQNENNYTKMHNDFSLTQKLYYREYPKLEDMTNKAKLKSSSQVLLNERSINSYDFASIYTYETYLYQYASYYHFDGDKVVELARNLTNNYTISFAEVNNVSYEVECSAEVETMIFVNQLNRNKLIISLEDMDMSRDDFITDEEIVTINEDLILDSGLSYSQYLGNIADLIGLDKNYALAISLYESGRVTSNIATTKNNFGGLSNGSYLSFATPEAGIIAYCCNLKEYENYNIENIEQLSGLYTRGNRNLPSENWVYNVYWIHYEISNNNEKYFDIQESSEELVLTVPSDKTIN